MTNGPAGAGEEVADAHDERARVDGYMSGVGVEKIITEEGVFVGA